MQSFLVVSHSISPVIHTIIFIQTLFLEIFFSNCTTCWHVRHYVLAICFKVYYHWLPYEHLSFSTVPIWFFEQRSPQVNVVMNGWLIANCLIFWSLFCSCGFADAAYPCPICILASARLESKANEGHSGQESNVFKLTHDI